MREMRVLEVTQAVGPSKFTPQILSWRGLWKNYHRWDVRIGQNVTAEYYNLPEAQAFLERELFKSQTCVHPPFRKPSLDGHPAPPPKRYPPGDE